MEGTTHDISSLPWKELLMTSAQNKLRFGHNTVNTYHANYTRKSDKQIKEEKAVPLINRLLLKGR